MLYHSQYATKQKKTLRDLVDSWRSVMNYTETFFIDLQFKSSLVQKHIGFLRQHGRRRRHARHSGIASELRGKYFEEGANVAQWRGHVNKAP